MRVFVTGATGHIGSAVVPELIAAGHQVVGLSRSDSGAAALDEAGAEVLRGDLMDHDSLRRGASESEGVIHLAFQHDLMRSGGHGDASANELQAVHALGAALEGTDKPFVTTSGTLLLASLGRIGTEDDTLESGPRIDAENATVALAERGVRSSVVRLSPSVHSSLDHHGFVPGLIAMARDQGVSPYVGDGANRWPGVHTLDAARLYRLALESAPAGTRLHGVADEGVPFKEIAEVIGRHLDVPVRSITPDEAPGHFSYLATFVQLDGPVSSDKTRRLLGWEPTHPGLIADIDEGHYFQQ